MMNIFAEKYLNNYMCRNYRENEVYISSINYYYG